MSTVSTSLRDAATMLRRDLRHAVRAPMMTVGGISVPVVFLLLFSGVFGRALRAGLSTGSAHGTSYIDYLAPGVILMTAGAAAAGTAINVCLDRGSGIVLRFRTMGISRMSVLTGQVVGSVIRTMISAVLVVAVAILLGFRPAAGPVEWLAAAGLFGLIASGLTWLAVAFGLLANTPAGANSLSLVPEFLPFLSSAFVPTATMPAAVRWFSQYEPFTPITDTLRGLFNGGPTGQAAVAVAWCLALSIGGYLWARGLYNRPGLRRAGEGSHGR